MEKFKKLLYILRFLISEMGAGLVEGAYACLRAHEHGWVYPESESVETALAAS